ncbi:MAG TPA: Rossmann-like and DUF2520 domain-containing protein [Gemmatimonadaceae bacterium]|nr:Rossmann-like and DUF2520 domain-containing protein [Gemmatimonadaceae bacterium]
MSERVFIIGPGHVGRGLFRAFRASGVDVVGMHGKRPSGVATSTGSIPADAARANVIVLCVRDPQLDETIIEVSAAAAEGKIARGSVILHTSAIAEPAGLTTLNETGFPGGTFHPLIPFSDPEISAELLRKGWIGIDGENAAKNASRRLAGHLGARTLEIPPGKKPAYHAAAVIASNFPVVLASVAGHLLHELGIPDASAYQAVESLMSGALSNMKRTVPDDALTGPIVRGDAETVSKHLRSLKGHRTALEVYRALSAAAVEIAERRGVDQKKLAAVTGLLRPVR